MLNVPAISPALRENTLRISDNLPTMTGQVFSSLLTMKEYADLTAATRQDVNASIVFSARLWFRSLLEGTSPSQDDVRQFQEFGKRRVHQGVPLQALLRSFRLGSLELWRQYIEAARYDGKLTEELLLNISPYLLEYFDVMAQLISQAYLEEQYQQARWREALRHQLYAIVFSFPEDTDGFRQTALALRLDPTEPRVALVIDHGGIDSQSVQFTEKLGQLELTVARRLNRTTDDLVSAWHRGRLLLWAPVVRGNSINANDQLMARHMAQLQESLPASAAIGVGLMGQGAAGWASSAQEAIRALDDGRRRQEGRRVLMYSDIVIEESVLGTGSQCRYLVSLLEQLANEPDLLLTLKTCFDHSLRRKTTAQALGIHPNTLNYRLERIEKLLGARLDDPNWMTKLHVALKLYNGGNI